MATLRQISTQVLDVLDVPFNEALNRDIQHRIIDIRNLYTKRIINKGRSDERYMQSFDVTMEELTEVDAMPKKVLGSETSKLKLYESINAIPVTLSYYKSSPFTSLYIRERKIVIKEAMFINYSLLHDYFKTRFTKDTLVYAINDNKIVLLSSFNIETITVVDIFENPLIIKGEFDTFNIGGVMFNENAEFPVDSDLIPVIINDVIEVFNGNAKDNIPTEN